MVIRGTYKVIHSALVSPKKITRLFRTSFNEGGEYKRSGYMQCVPVILAEVPARTMFKNIFEPLEPI